MRKHIYYALLGLLIAVIILLNYICYNHAYKFTHYVDIKESRLKVYDNSSIGLQQKISYILTGVDVPRPKNSNSPQFDYSTEIIPTKKGNLEVWSTNVPNATGTIILFHGYANKKSSLISRATKFYQLGYNVVMVDFLGSGGSDGNTNTIGYYEADQVKACYDHVKAKGENNIYLFGISMGAVAIMKCIKDHNPEIKGIILECPFGYMRTTVKNRFGNFGIPTFPMADLLMLWGSYHTGYWTYSHNPAEYAMDIQCPTLLLYGEKDHAVTRKEIDAIYTNLRGKKYLEVFSNTGHDIFTYNNTDLWSNAINKFLVNTGTLSADEFTDPNNIDAIETSN